MSSFCAECGSRLERGSQFCESCGAPARPRALATPRSLEGLYHFVRSHLLIVNSLVGFASTSVALLDFLSPRLWILPRLIYSATAMLACVLLAAAVLPGLDRWLLGWLSSAEARRHPLWRSGSWQFAVLLLALVTGFGFESVAKASQGGVLAARFPAVRAFQQQFLQLHQDIVQVEQGVNQANTRLKVLVDAQHSPAQLLQARGYALSSNGLAKAIASGDEWAVGQFSRMDFQISKPGPILALLGRHGERWDPRIASLLRPSMFTTPRACGVTPVSNVDLFGHLAQRCEAFARLCGPATLNRMAGHMPDVQRELQQMQISHRFWGQPVDASEQARIRAFFGRTMNDISVPSRWQNDLSNTCRGGFHAFPFSSW